MISIATKPKNVSQKAFDYFSFGHVLFGFTSEVIILLILSLFLPLVLLGYSLLVNAIVGILWELIENTLLVNTKYKFMMKRDSVINSQVDVLLVIIGGIISFVLISVLEFFDAVVVSIVIYTVLLIMYDFTQKLTINEILNENN